MYFLKFNRSFEQCTKEKNVINVAIKGKIPWGYEWIDWYGMSEQPREWKKCVAKE